MGAARAFGVGIIAAAAGIVVPLTWPNAPTWLLVALWTLCGVGVLLVLLTWDRCPVEVQRRRQGRTGDGEAVRELLVASSQLSVAISPHDGHFDPERLDRRRADFDAAVHAALPIIRDAALRDVVRNLLVLHNSVFNGRPGYPLVRQQAARNLVAEMAGNPSRRGVYASALSEIPRYWAIQLHSNQSALDATLKKARPDGELGPEGELELQAAKEAVLRLAATLGGRAVNVWMDGQWQPEQHADTQLYPAVSVTVMKCHEWR